MGASDTAGYCVDGTPDQNYFQDDILGWQYENCVADYVSLVSSNFDADFEVIAIAGIGLT